MPPGLPCLRAGACNSDARRCAQVRYVQYQFAHQRPMSVAAMAQLLGNTLYYKRFFPYYTFNLCAGLDAEGAAASYPALCLGPMLRTRLSKVHLQPVRGPGRGGCGAVSLSVACLVCDSDLVLLLVNHGGECLFFGKRGTCVG
jgi:hypothetical protein